MLEACKQSADLLLSAKSASTEQYKEDVKALEAECDKIAGELSSTHMAMSHQLAAKDEELARLQKQLNKIESKVLTRKRYC